MLARNGIHIDLNPLSVFIVKNLIEPIDLAALGDAFHHVVEQFKRHAPTTDAQIEKALRDYP
jgi:hypothetical protein